MLQATPASFPNLPKCTAAHLLSKGLSSSQNNKISAAIASVLCMFVTASREMLTVSALHWQLACDCHESRFCLATPIYLKRLSSVPTHKHTR